MVKQSVVQHDDALSELSGRSDVNASLKYFSFLRSNGDCLSQQEFFDYVGLLSDLAPECASYLECLHLGQLATLASDEQRQLAKSWSDGFMYDTVKVLSSEYSIESLRKILLAVQAREKIDSYATFSEVEHDFWYKDDVERS